MNVFLKKSIPNFITLSNLFLGFTSIILLSLSLNDSASYVQTACYLILIACILDSFDGKIARKLNISSDFGKEIDSLADLVSFCIVPSLLVFVYYILLASQLSFILLLFRGSFPLMFGAVRLAKYNSLKDMRESEKYLGLPTPANAILICSLILFTYNMPYRAIMGSSNKFFDLCNSLLSNIFIFEYMILFISIISSMLLMSKINFEKFPLISFRINKKNNLDLLKLILFLIILGVSFADKSYDIVLLLFIMIYIFGNMIKYLVNLIKK